jgi:hypothetical protein
MLVWGSCRPQPGSFTAYVNRVSVPTEPRHTHSSEPTKPTELSQDHEKRKEGSSFLHRVPLTQAHRVQVGYDHHTPRTRLHQTTSSKSSFVDFVTIVDLVVFNARSAIASFVIIIIIKSATDHGVQFTRSGLRRRFAFRGRVPLGRHGVSSPLHGSDRFHVSSRF